MPIQVYERFDKAAEEALEEVLKATPSTARGCQLWQPLPEKNDASSRGELWETIEWDFMAPSWRTTGRNGVLPSAGWQLKCDFRMPAHGILRFMHPQKDEALEFSYDTPTLLIPHYTPGVIKQKSFTAELKKSWEAMPKEWSCQVGPTNGRSFTLTCTKDIVDAIESNILGELYIYRPTELRIN
jgi:hypothetical protein